jgi:hypothetical protein
MIFMVTGLINSWTENLSEWQWREFEVDNLYLLKNKKQKKTKIHDLVQEQIDDATWSAWRIPTAVFSDFYIAVTTFSFKELLSCTDEADWTPFQTHYFSTLPIEALNL